MRFTLICLSLSLMFSACSEEAVPYTQENNSTLSSSHAKGEIKTH